MDTEQITSNHHQAKWFTIELSKKFCFCALIVWLNVLLISETSALESEHSLQQQTEIRLDNGNLSVCKYNLLENTTPCFKKVSSSTRNATPYFSNVENLDPPPNPVTCFSTGQKSENKCIQVIQARFSEVYHKTFNSTLEFRLIYTYPDVSHVSVSSACLKIILFVKLHIRFSRGRILP